MTQKTQPPRIDERLRSELSPLARRIRSRRWHRIAAVAWLVAAALAFASSVVASLLHLTVIAGLAVAGIVALCAGWFLRKAWRRLDLDFHRAAALVEEAFPDLRQVLLTAVEQAPPPDGKYTFLQRQVLAQARRHALLHDWRNLSAGGAWLPRFAHAGAAVLFVAASLFSFRLPAPERGAVLASAAPSVEVQPGDVEVERGSPVVISARFEGRVPETVTVHWIDSHGTTGEAEMSRSLADPVFAHTLFSVSQELRYTVEFPGGEAGPHSITVYDLPALVRADATIEHPDYTGLGLRTIHDTRRVSAVEGSRVTLEFEFNKPIARAQLVGEVGHENLQVSAANDTRTKYTTAIDLRESRRFKLLLEDAAGRANRRPREFRLEALPNKPPELRLTSPRGDVRVSAIEEVPLRSEARDDFGLLDWGLGYSVGTNEPTEISLRDKQPPDFEARFEYLLALEGSRLAPGDLVAWYAWARDIGPDGKPRKTESDLFFGEVRPFDEIFRESEGGAGQQGQNGNMSEGEELIETQRQISIALWKLRQRPPADPDLPDDIDAVREAQDSARQMLEAQREQIREERLRSFADEAADFMDQTGSTLSVAYRTRQPDALRQAWQTSQGAYQALLRMLPNENSITRSRSASRSGASRNQRQLDRLRFRDEDDPYETESQAEAMTSPEEREQLRAISRLRELARRQQEINSRLQELQTALQAAETQEERERIQRELKRLEEEQRRMLADLDEVRNQLDRRRQDSDARQASQQLEQTRRDMERSSEALGEGSVSEALASGTRAREQLEQARDDLRRNRSSRFAEDMRNLRRRARELAEAQRESAEQIQDLDSGGFRSLSDDDERRSLASDLEARSTETRELLNEMQRITEEAEDAEPGLYRKLYDTLREHGQDNSGEALETAADLLRRGFVREASEMQSGVTRKLEELEQAIDDAARYVLGDDTSTLRFARQELEDLASALGRERPDETGPEASTESSGEDARPGDRQGQTSEAQPGGETETDELMRALQELADARLDAGGRQGGPLTGGGFGEWADRLRTVESLLESDEARGRIAGARRMAESLRGEYKRHGEPPKWEMIEAGIEQPLNEVGRWLKQEISRLEDPTALNPADRDPVPEQFAEAVERYYESLSQ